MPSLATWSLAGRRYARPALTLFALYGACSAMSCSSAARPQDEDAALPPTVDDSCSRFGFRFTSGGCPAAACAEPLCTCPTPIRCIPGMNDRCMSGLDCDAACAVDAESVFVCSIEIEPCATDADCGAGRCVAEPSAASGECESAERGARCRNDDDCLVGNCVAGDNASRACSPGEASDLCNHDDDCQSGSCVLEAGALTGECE